MTFLEKIVDCCDPLPFDADDCLLLDPLFFEAELSLARL